MTPQEFLGRSIAAARVGGHIWPDYAACEAAEESGWGGSQLAQRANNLFGQKWPTEKPPGWKYPSMPMQTEEYIHGAMLPVTCFWPIFPDWATAFRERMRLLHRLSAYAPALAAASGEAFIRLVSPVWATDPKRTDNVLAIYRANQPAIAAALAATTATEAA